MLYTFSYQTYSSATLHDDLPPSADWPPRGLEDDPFLETLFGAMCRDLLALPGESFVDQAARWTDALRFTASLKPRDQQEWLRAADVTIKQFSAVYSLVMRKQKGITAKQRLRYDKDFLLHAKAMQNARLRYDLMRKSDAS